ncbi:hypothetical protein Val02_54270 [Virgisporangium aliadipatigenens]|uniref:DUF1501 domain-containing protein n=1 Tax=Virgisporangium aliadipatigenens TaxID=741659 RepID=A0A8J3YNM9_9ACTN|nr:DUF1501 domain-containing protein [Virgisporangium aliadipatigenens]GIJ48541.1 hypothetical protein Val02_54270 [Virgisporangium aliadipatigenens]
MDTVTRRRFLVASGVVGGTALAAGAGTLTWRELFRTEKLRSGHSTGTLVLITLYGGNDGLATVVPHADPAYRQARGDLAIPGESVLPLDQTVGLSPSLAAFKRQFDAGHLAVVRGVGYPKPDRSHFRSMDIWQTADPVQPGNTGWIGRFLDANRAADSRWAVTFEPVLPPVLAGASKAGAAVTTNGLKLPSGYRTPMLAGLGRPEEESPLRARAARAFADLVRVDEMVRGLPEHEETEETEDGMPAATSTGGGKASLAQQLRLIARCVEAEVAPRVYSASLGGFDLHADGHEAQLTLLRDLDKAVGSFLDRMARTPAGRRVVVAVYSEFGRRVRANASDGTDHGTASDMFLLGVPVRGGLYGAPPSLTDLDDGDLKYTTDFRDVYGTLLADVLDTDPAQVLGGWTGRLPELLH